MMFNPFYSPYNPAYYQNTSPTYFQKGHGGFSRDSDFWDEYYQPRRRYQQPNLRHGYGVDEDNMDGYYHPKRRTQYQAPTPSSQILRDEFYQPRRSHQPHQRQPNLEQPIPPPPPRKPKVVPQQNIISIHDGTIEKSYQVTDDCTLEQLKEHLTKEYDLELSDYIELSHNDQILGPNEATLDDLKIGYGSKLKFNKTKEYYNDEKQCNKINEYSKELEPLEEKAKTLNLNEKDAMILDEQLTFLLQKIDSIETNGRSHIRAKRKSLVLRAQQASTEANKNKIVKEIPTITSPSQAIDQTESEITEDFDNNKLEQEVINDNIDEQSYEEIKKKNEKNENEKEKEINEMNSNEESNLFKNEISQVVENIVDKVDKYINSPIRIDNENNDAFEKLRINETDNESTMEEDDGINTECAVADDITEDVTDDDDDYDTDDKDDSDDDTEEESESTKEDLQTPLVLSSLKRGRKRSSMSPVDEETILTKLFNEEDIEENVDADDEEDNLSNEEENDLTDNDESDLSDGNDEESGTSKMYQENCHDENEKIFLKDIQSAPKSFNKELLPSSSDSLLAELLYNRYRQSNPHLPAWYTLVN